MSDVALTQKIKCPECGHEFLLDQALSKQIEQQLRAGLSEEYAKKQQAADKKLAEVNELQKSLLQKEKSIDEQVQLKLDAEKKQLWVIAQKKAEENSQTKMKALEDELQDRIKKQRELEQKELDFAKKMRELEDQKATMQLDLEKKFIEKSQELEKAAREKAMHEADMKTKEKDMQLEQMRKTIEELKRKSEQGSMQVQGDTLENDLKEVLTVSFPQDTIDDVPTGIKGADLIQTVRTDFAEVSGIIIWESKNTKAWNDEWIRKLKEDQVQAKADVAILVTRTLPENIKDIGNVEGVWVVGYSFALMAARVLRSNLNNLAKLKKSLVGTDEKMQVLHRYLTGSQFKNRIENIVLAFSSMQQDLDKEKRLFQKQWTKREKEIERVITNTTGLYGDLQGVMGNSLQAVPALELDSPFDEDFD